MSEQNRRNIEDIPDYVQKEMKFVFVQDVLEVFEAALARAPASVRRLAGGVRGGSGRDTGSRKVARRQRATVQAKGQA